MKKLLISLALIFLLASPALGEDEYVIGHGVALLTHEVSVQKARQQAIAKASRQALEKFTTGILSESEVTNNTLISDRIVSQAVGVIKIHEVIFEQWQRTFDHGASWHAISDPQKQQVGDRLWMEIRFALKDRAKMEEILHQLLLKKEGGVKIATADSIRAGEPILPTVYLDEARYLAVFVCEAGSESCFTVFPDNQTTNTLFAKGTHQFDHYDVYLEGEMRGDRAEIIVLSTKEEGILPTVSYLRTLRTQVERWAAQKEVQKNIKTVEIF